MPIMSSLSFYIRKNLLLLFILSLAVIFTYLNILPNKLFFDDEELIYKNLYVADLRYLPNYFISNMIEGAGKISNMYRPVLTLSFALDHLVWGNNPIGYHLTSILLHLANTYLIYFLILMLCDNKQVSFISSLLFGVHPALSEAVIYASGRTDPLYVFWGLISVICFVLLFKTKKYWTFIYVLSLFCFIISLLAKETAVVIPFISVISVIYKFHFQRNLKKIIAISIPLFLIIIVYFILRLTVLNFSNTLNFYSGLSTDQVTQLYSTTLLVRLLTFSKVFFIYLGLLFFPLELVVARNSTIISNLSNIYVISFFFLNIFLLVISLVLYKKIRLLLFAFLWFYISIIPVSGIIPINNIIAEHYLYLPSVSFFLLSAFLFTSVMNYFRNSSMAKYLLKGTLILIIIGLSFRTVIRTYDWRDPIRFYSLSLKQSPNNLPMRHNLAMAYQDQGNLLLAIKEYNNIVAQGDIYPQTRHNLGNAYKTLEEYSQAEIEYKKALEIDPKFYFTYIELADLYQKTGEKDKLSGIRSIINSLKLHPL